MKMKKKIQGNNFIDCERKNLPSLHGNESKRGIWVVTSVIKSQVPQETLLINIFSSNRSWDVL